jgi:polar amino acid transport system substrate-binding protein
MAWAIVAALGWATLPSQAQTTVRLARIENIPDQAVGGEILKAVYRRMNIQLLLVDMPAKRALLESSAGHVDGEVQRILAVKDEYPSLLPVRVAVNYIEPSAFVKRKQFPVEGWDSIKPYAIGIVRGVGSSERGTRGMARVEATTTMDLLMEMLDAERIDVAVNDLFSGVLVNRRLGLDKSLHPLSPPLERILLYHFLHESHRDLAARVEETMRQMQASGDLEKLRKEITERMLDDARK